MRQWKDDLVPVLLEMMQDSTAAVKREVRYYRIIIPKVQIVVLVVDVVVVVIPKCKLRFLGHQISWLSDQMIE